MARFATRTVIAAVMGAAFLAVPAAQAGGVGGSDATGVGFTGGNNVNVQVNIDNTKVINADSNVAITKTFNGVNVGYGLGGASVLGVINQRSADAQSLSDQRSATAQQVANQAQYIAEAVAAYGGY